MGKRIVIAGAGGFGRGLLSWIRSSPVYLERQHISEVVFIDDREPAVRPRLPVISTIREYLPEPNDVALCAIGIPAIRRLVVQELEKVGARFHTFVDDRAVVGEGVTIGEGSIVCPGSVISADVTIGNHVHINFNCSLGHDSTLADFTTLSPGVNIMGQVPVGSLVFVGGSAVVLPRLSVGSEAVLGAGAVVTVSVPPGATMVGNPARPILARGPS